MEPLSVTYLTYSDFFEAYCIYSVLALRNKMNELGAEIEGGDNLLF